MNNKEATKIDLIKKNVIKKELINKKEDIKKKIISNENIKKEVISIEKEEDIKKEIISNENIKKELINNEEAINKESNYKEFKKLTKNEICAISLQTNINIYNNMSLDNVQKDMDNYWNGRKEIPNISDVKIKYKLMEEQIELDYFNKKMHK